MLVENSFKLRPPYKIDTNQSWYTIGDIYYQMANFRDAIKAFRRALRSDPNDMQACMAIGNSYSDLGRASMAEKYFRKALLIDDQYRPVKFNLANSLFDQKRFDEAIEYYREVSTDANDDLSVKAKSMIKMSRTHKTNARKPQKKP